MRRPIEVFAPEVDQVLRLQGLEDSRTPLPADNLDEIRPALHRR